MKDTDCATIANLRPAGFTNDGFDFAVALPVSGVCPANSPAPVYRTFRAAAGGKTSNHRYTTSTANRDSMIARGWANEGIAFCAPSAISVALSPNIVNYEKFLLDGGNFNLRFGTGYIIAQRTVATASPGTAGARIDSPYVNVTKTLAMPDTSTFARDRVLTLANPDNPDGVVASLDPLRSFIRYDGDGIRFDTLTPDGRTIAYTSMTNGVSNVDLKGTIAATPADVIAIYPQLAPGATAGLNTNATWLPGAAYAKRVNTRAGDTYLLFDCSTPATLGIPPTPCPSSKGVTLEKFFPRSDTTAPGGAWKLTDGKIRTLGTGSNELRVWVANTPFPSANSATLAYRTFVEADEVYLGALQPDGAILSTNTTGGVVGYQLRFNKAAIDSITAALSF